MDESQCFALFDTYYDQEDFLFQSKDEIVSPSEFQTRLKSLYDSDETSQDDRQKALLFLENGACHPYAISFLQKLRERIIKAQEYYEKSLDCYADSEFEIKLCQLENLIQALSIDRGNYDAYTYIPGSVASFISSEEYTKQYFPLVLQAQKYIDPRRFITILIALVFFKWNDRLDEAQEMYSQYDRRSKISLFLKTQFLVSQSMVLGNRSFARSIDDIRDIDSDKVHEKWEDGVPMPLYREIKRDIEQDLRDYNSYWGHNFGSKKIKESLFFDAYRYWVAYVAQYIQTRPNIITPTSEMIQDAQLIERLWYEEFDTPYLAPLDHQYLFEKQISMETDDSYSRKRGHDMAIPQATKRARY